MSKSDQRARDYDRDLEERQARGLLHALTGEDLAPVDKPDAAGMPWTPGKKPDFEFAPTAGMRCFVEVTRLLPPTLRQVEDFAKEHIGRPLAGVLPGSFFLWVYLDSLSRKGIPPEHAQGIVRDIVLRVRHGKGVVPRSFEPVTGYRVERFDDSGSRLIPMVLAADLPYDLGAHDPRAIELRSLFVKTVLEASEKFRSRAGRHILLIDISQTGLDAEIHVMAPGMSPSLMTTWTDDLPAQASSVQEIYVEPGISVWVSSDPRANPFTPQVKIRAGTRYSDEPRGFYLRLRPQPTRPV
ncbi:MAG: hypothetical protein M3077_05740 [Candidatus Dormibacteraeota bacterium]|nr:hypothetical protein [Candidatus Dormibacteraeota bacterium]